MRTFIFALLALVAVASAAELQVSISGVEPLGNNFFYEGWFIGNGNSPLSTGALSVSANNIASQIIDVNDDVLSTFTGYLVTIEPADGNPAPAATRLIGGDFSGDTADLTITFGAALGTDFLDASGFFILATPSEPTADNDLGIWFMDTSGPSPVAGLTLPTLPEGWVYEGWVVFDGVPTSTGYFTDPAAADNDGAGPTAGSNTPLPNYPGQDFINPPMSVLDANMVVLSVEPFPDDSPAPFAIKPLRQTVIQDITTNQMILQNPGTIPTGVARVVANTGSSSSTNSPSSSPVSTNSGSSSSSSSGSSSSSSSDASTVAVSALALAAMALAYL